MATRRSARQAAQRRKVRTNSRAHRATHHRPLRHEPLEDRRLLATVTVDTLADTVDFADGRTSLREAVFATNLVGGPDTIQFAPALFIGGPGKILLTQGELSIADSLTIAGPGSQLLTIDASGNDPTPIEDNGDGSRIFSTSSRRNQPLIDVTIVGMTLTGGDTNSSGGALLSFVNLTLDSVRITDNFGGELGGGIAHRDGALRIVDSELSDNSTRGRGGAINSLRPVTIESSQIIDNTAMSDGGGIAMAFGNGPAQLTVTGSTISGNTVTNLQARGGGIFFEALLVSEANQFSVHGSTISENSAPAAGGGLWLRMLRGTLLLDGNTIAGNTATQAASRGGGAYLRVEQVPTTISRNAIHENVAGSGGGLSINNLSSALVIEESSIAMNRATGGEGTGGGVSFIGSAVTSTIRNSTINDNTATSPGGRGGGIFAGNLQTLTVSGSVISGNSATASGGGIYASSTLHIMGSTISGNSAVGAKGSGGGISHIGGSNRELRVSDSEISGNTAKLTGGGLHLLGSLGLPVIIERSRIVQNSADMDGGGIVNNGRTVRITDSAVNNNSAGARGGGVFTSGGSLQITASDLNENTATQSGGAIMTSSPLTLIETLVRDNSAMQGGGIYVFRANVTLEGSTLADNSASLGGGGIFMRIGGVSLRQSTLSGNTSAGDGGGISAAVAYHVNVFDSTLSGNSADHNGGGISLGQGPLNIRNSTFSDNSADNLGGGIFVNSGATITHSTLTLNRAGQAGGGLFTNSGPIVLDHTIAASNFASAGREVTGLLGAVIEAHYSLIGDSHGSGLTPAPIGSPDANGNIIGGASQDLINPILGPLANNGGPTMTHALRPDSPAINAGDPSAVPGVADVPTFDQRGEPFARVFGGRIDMGAYELQPNPLQGDYNFNGVVDLADYAVWRSTLGSRSDLRADGDNNGIVDEADRLIWRANFGNTRPAEPQIAGLESPSDSSDARSRDLVPFVTQTQPASNQRAVVVTQQRVSVQDAERADALMAVLAIEEKHSAPRESAESPLPQRDADRSVATDAAFAALGTF